MKSEVPDLKIEIFSQAYAVEMYAKESREEGREEGKLQAKIEMCQEIGHSYEETVARVMRKYGLQRDVAEKYMNDYWK